MMSALAQDKTEVTMHTHTQRSNAGRGQRPGPAARAKRNTAFSRDHQTTITGSEYSAAADYMIQRREKLDAGLVVNVLSGTTPALLTGVLHRTPRHGGPVRFIQAKPKVDVVAADLEQLQAQNTKDGDAAGMTAPPVVDETLSAPGRPLDENTRAFMEPRFGWDFSNVRIHADTRSAVAARSVQARAFTSGSNIVFGEGEYAPGTSTGRNLLAHELTHVVQQGGAARPAAGTHETAMGRSTGQTLAQRIGRKTIRGGEFIKASAALQLQKKIIQRKKKRKFLGGILGAIGGAVLGALVGGPIGAIVGAIGGALIGDRITRRRRRLTDEETTDARDIYRNSLNYSKIVLTRDSILSIGASKTIGNTIHLEDSLFHEDTMSLTSQGRRILIHEMGHVWQYQNGGLAYIPKALWAQLQSTVKTGSMDGAYEWEKVKDTPWEDWNPEQQAEFIEDYYSILRANPYDPRIAEMLPNMKKVWSGEGAPRFFKKKKR